MILLNCSPGLDRFWHPVARSDQIGAQPHKVRLLDVDYAIYRTKEGLACFVDRCPHRLAPLSIGSCDEAGVIACAYHGWRFATDGRCIEVPALGSTSATPRRAELTKPFAIKERYGLVYLAISPPLSDVMDIEVDGDDSFMVGDVPVIEVRASAGIMVDNFLDIAHFPFVHAKTFGAEETEQVEPYEVLRDGMCASLSYEHYFSNREDEGVALGLRPLLQRRRMTYRYFAPFSVTLRLDFLETGGTNLIVFAVQPVDNQTCRLYSSLWRNDLGGDGEKMKDAIEFELAVLEEDLAIQAAYRDLSFPLDPTLEVHTRADKLTLAMRRILSEALMEA